MRRRIIDEPDIPPQINIVPMIDVIFAILTFFIMSTLFLARIESLTVNLPEAETSQAQKSVRVIVTLDKDAQLYLNKKPMELSELSTAVMDYDEPGKNLVVVLNADGSVTHDRVVEVMDAIRQIDGAKLAIATKKTQ